jgi:DNA primase
MSLPSGFLDELRGRLSLGQVVGRKVVWDNRKSNPGKGDLWAPCPFHQEKTASFHVDDRKGFYYCFGCHAKGDAISFVRETENVGFAEAVEILAREAGMPLPDRDPRAAEQADRRGNLASVVEQAVQFYRLQLRKGAAAEARAYLARRGLSEAAQARWEIGFAPDDRQALFRHLTGKGIAPDLIVAAGVAAHPEGDGPPYDRFRERIIFPIRDARGRAISLGGRAMAVDAKAKYLNGPETDLFDKGRSLFNLGPAREASGKGKPLIVAEGYMDVIALCEAGFAATVAPLGTAVTAEQLSMMWRLSDEPVIALDGDKAGFRAALRVIDLALPMLEAGKGLRFALLPDGMDPDDLIRAKGPGAMQIVIDGAVSMVRLLWQRETEGREFDSPERKAALDKSLRAAITTIKDPSIRAHYGDEIKELRWQLFGTRRPALRRTAYQPPQAATPAAKASRLGAGALSEDHLREAVILGTLIANPAIIPDFVAELERFDTESGDHERLRMAILRLGMRDDLRTAIDTEFGPATLEKLFGERHVAVIPAIRRPGDHDKARLCVAEELAKLNARRGHVREIADAVEDMAGLVDEGVTWRLGQAAHALDRAQRGDNEDRTEYETGPNGARMKRDERSAFDQILDSIDFAKGGRPPRA